MKNRRQRSKGRQNPQDRGTGPDTLGVKNQWRTNDNLECQRIEKLKPMDIERSLGRSFAHDFFGIFKPKPESQGIIAGADAPAPLTGRCSAAGRNIGVSVLGG